MHNFYGLLGLAKDFLMSLIFFPILLVYIIVADLQLQGSSSKLFNKKFV